MFGRMLNPLKSHSFFLFGARGTGKSTLIHHLFQDRQTHFIDLLDSRVFDEYLLYPGLLLERFGNQSKLPEWIIIDEVQKIPRLLDEVHKLIFQNKQKFVLTGSSARKLKREGVNLLAGRALTYNLYPLTFSEYGDKFDLQKALQWGSLPQVASEEDPLARKEILTAYISTYLQQEIIAEQIVRKIEGFRRFLRIAAQSNGKILNYESISRDVGIDPTTVKTYFEILNDTLIGVILPAFHLSIRKQQRLAPKFYFFDCGVQRTLLGLVDQKITPSTYDYGNAFEHFIILEIMRISSYRRKSFEFYYLRTKEGAEIDLIIERPGSPTVIVEIKSSTHVDDIDVGKLSRFIEDFPACEALILSNEPIARRVNGIEILPWKEGIERIVS